jgi:hypothetical protein
VLSELLAEAWMKAVTRWKNGERLPVRFDSRSLASSDAVAREPGLRSVGAPVPQGKGNPQRSTTGPDTDNLIRNR